MCNFEDALCRAPISITIEIDPAAMCPQPQPTNGSIIDRNHTYDMPDECKDIQKDMEAIGMCPTKGNDPKDGEKDNDGSFPLNKEKDDKPDEAEEEDQ